MKVQWIGIGILGICIVAGETEALNKENATAHSFVVAARESSLAGDKEKAASLYQEALQIDSKNEAARLELTELLIQSQIDMPYSEQTEVMAIIEENVATPIFSTQRFPLTFLNNAALKANDESMNHKVLLILQRLQRNKNESAIKLSETLRKQYPQHPVPYNLLGLAWQGKGDPSKAQEFFEKALILNDNFHAARINLAELELHLGEFNAAHQALDTVLKSDTHNRRACLVKAQLYSLEGQMELAKLWYSKVSEAL